MQYTVKNGQIIFDNGEQEIPINSLAVMYDKDSGTLLKHGEEYKVRAYCDDYYNSLKNIHPAMANDAAVAVLNSIDPQKACDAVNKMITITGTAHRIISELSNAE